jgi:hypothetical protein
MEIKYKILEMREKGKIQSNHDFSQKCEAGKIENIKRAVYG